MYLVRPKNVHIKEWRIFIMDFGMSMPRAAEDMMQAVLIISVIGTILAIAYEDEIDELRYRTNRCCKKTKRKMREMQSYLE